MFRDALWLTFADFRHLLRHPETWLWAFVMPVLFFYFIGTITAGFAGDLGARDKVALWVPPDAGFLADQLVRRLEAQEYEVVRVETPAELERHRRRLLLPAGFTATVLAAKPVTLQVKRTGGGLGADYDELRLGRAVYGLLADLLVVTRDGKAAAPEAFDRLAERPRQLRVQVEAAGQRKEIPTGFQQAVPGCMVFLVLLVLTTNGVTLTMERQQGVLRRLASSPMSRGAVVLGKWGARVLLGVIQVGFAMVTGAVLFHIRWGPHYAVLLLVLFAYVALAATLGMLLGNFGRSQAQVGATGAIAANVLAALGGCWWPIEITPAWSRTLAHFLPTGWAMDALHKLLSFGAPPSAVLPHLTALAVAALAAGYVLARGFRFQ